MNTGWTTSRGLFITGTDTGVGKTHIGTRLAKRLADGGLDVQPRKPVESGCRPVEGVLFPEDGNAYFRAVSGRVPLECITPLRLEAALAPPEAARQLDYRLTLSELVESVNRDLPDGSCCLVEGAGGFYSPIAEDGLNADLAGALNWPVMVVAADRLGCINHVLLTLEAIERRALKAAAVVLNTADPGDISEGMDNATALRRLTDTPVLTTRYTPQTETDNELELEPLLKIIEGFFSNKT
jgi:dethiobiotin synthetase